MAHENGKNPRTGTPKSAPTGRIYQLYTDASWRIGRRTTRYGLAVVIWERGRVFEILLRQGWSRPKRGHEADAVEMAQAWLAGREHLGTVYNDSLTCRKLGAQHVSRRNNTLADRLANAARTDDRRYLAHYADITTWCLSRSPECLAVCPFSATWLDLVCDTLHCTT